MKRFGVFVPGLDPAVDVGGQGSDAAVGRVISTVDPEARYAHKTRERRQDGFKAHVVVEPDMGLTTVCELTKTNGSANSDARVGAELIVADPTLGEDGLDAAIEVLGDSAYASGEMLHTVSSKKWVPLVKPWPLRPAVEGGFTLDDFTYDAASTCLTCPAGITRTPSMKRTVTFGAACRGCPLRAQCTTAASGRAVRLGEHHQLQREHRTRAAAEGFQTIYRQHPPMVERSIAWLTRGAPRVPYRGIEKNNNWLHRRAAALNLRRLLTLGLTIDNGAWALA